MHAKMDVNFVVMHFTHVSGHKGAYSKKKWKIKLRQNCSVNVISDWAVRGEVMWHSLFL